MSEPIETREPSGPRGLGPERSAALGGAFIVGVTMLVATAVRSSADIWLVAIAAVTVIFAALALGRPRVTRSGERLQAKETRHSTIAEAILAHIPDPVILVDQRSLVVEANEAARAMLPGLKTDHPLSFALRSPVVLDGIDGALSGEGPLKVEYSERVPTERTFEVHIGLLRGNPADLGGRTGVVLVFRDLTSTRRLEAMRADFVANASHELRTPLASLLGFVETLQGPARNDAAARERFLEIMREQAQRMKRLIDNLLSLSRIEMRAHVPPTEPVDLKAVTAHMIEMLTPLARERGTLVEARLPDRPLVVPGDRDELLRVCENLIENAVKYGESGGRVEVELSRVETPDGKPQAVLAVQDYGPGIAPEHLPRLTERFYRVDGAQSRDKGGTGLGLAIVKHIVNRHRGRFDIVSEPEQGARFTVTLPASAEI